MALFDQPTEPRNITQIIFKNATLVTIGILLLKGVNFVFNVFVVRKLGDDRFGQYSIVLAFVNLFQILAELGMSQYVMREVSRDLSKAGTYFWNLVTLRGILAIAAMIFLPLIGAQMGYSPNLLLGILIYSSTFLLSAIAVPLGDILAASEELGFATGINVASQIAFVVFGSVFLFSGFDYIWIIIASLISILPRIGMGWWAVKKLRITNLPFNLDLRLWPKLIRAGLPFGITSLMLSIAFSIDTVILSRYQPENVVGWYNVAYGLIFSIIYLFGGFRTAIVPTLSKTFMHDVEKIEEWYRGSFKFIFLISVPMAIGGVIVAFPLVHFLYTPEFLPSALALQILIWDLPVVLFSQFCWDMSVIVGEEHAAAKINMVNTTANVILNLIFIPKYGLVAAALITVITDFISSLQFHFLFRRKLHLPDMKSTMARVLIASLLMAIPTWYARYLQFFMTIGIAVIVYGVLILIFRLIESKEIDVVVQLLRKIRINMKIQKIV